MEAGSYAYNEQALHPEEQQTLRSGEGGLMTQDYQQQQGGGYYQAENKQYGAPPAPSSAPYYGPYGGQQAFDIVDVQAGAGSNPPPTNPPGSGLLGGIGIGSSVQQGPPPPYYNHQNF